MLLHYYNNQITPIPDDQLVRKKEGDLCRTLTKKHQKSTFQGEEHTKSPGFMGNIALTWNYKNVSMLVPHPYFKLDLGLPRLQDKYNGICIMLPQCYYHHIYLAIQHDRLVKGKRGDYSSGLLLKMTKNPTFSSKKHAGSSGSMGNIVLT